MTPFESPGLRRRIELHPSPGVLSAGLEDDMHRFLLRMTHANGAVTGIETRGDRIPWSTCGAAGNFLAEQAVGQRLEDVARLDAHIHCTHLYELMVLCARHANDTVLTRFDLWAADREGTRTHAALRENGRAVLDWQVDGTLITGPDDWNGRDLRKMSVWKRELSPAVAEQAMLLRRAIHISGGRNPALVRPQRAADRGAERMGACFTYQMPRALDAIPSPDWRRDFTAEPPLQNFDPAWRP